jgi:formate-dependent nitrite reductase membrane component NrfD
MSDRPIIKAPVWTWEIPIYFYVGGLAGASAGVARLAEARGNDALADRAAAVAAAGAAVSPALLISDLGRPARFLHMLRMFKVTSPMSIGSWTLAAFGTAAGAGLLDRLAGGRVPGGRAARTAAAMLGLPLASYTAALVTNTAVPVWHESRRILPFVFVAGAGASSGAMLTALTPAEHAAPARRLAVGAAAVDIAATQLLHRRVAQLAEAYRSTADTASTVALAAGAGLIAAAARRSRAAAVAGGALVTAGAVLARWSVYKAGFRSAADPSDTVAPQRARLRARSS